MLVVVMLVALLAAPWLWMRRRHRHWRSLGVPGPGPSFPFGNCTASCLGRRAVYEDFADLYQSHRHQPYLGIYYMHTPILMINDLEIVKQILVKDFPDFCGRGVYSDPERDPLTGNLFNLHGQQWRSLRAKLSPAFTRSKIKYYFHRIQECAASLQRHVEGKVSAGGGSYREDLRDLIARYGTDIIASLIFGLESDCTNQPDSEFRAISKTTLRPSFVNGMGVNLHFFARDLLRVLKLRVPGLYEFWSRIVGDTVAYREENGVQRADLMNLLIQLKNKGFVALDGPANGNGSTQEKDLQKLTLDQVVAQVFIFFLAGFETSSITGALALNELAKNPAVLRKATEEVDRLLQQHDGAITFEAITNAPYLDAVVNETLRLHPPLQFLTREVMRTRTLPGTDLVLKKGTILLIPLNGIQRNPEHWTDPDSFVPARFTEGDQSAAQRMAFMPFGSGPRTCIAMRLGLVQVKAALMALLSRFSVSRSPDTQDTMKIEPWGIVPHPRGGLPLTLSRRTQASSDTPGQDSGRDDEDGLANSRTT